MSLALKDQTTEQMAAELASLNIGLRDVRVLQRLSMGMKLDELPQVAPSGIAKKRWQTILDAVHVPNLSLIDKVQSPKDGFTKYLFSGEGPDPFEAVRIPLLHRPGKEKYVVCVSSQVGCAAKCAFCATGRLGFRRNLHTWEIVDQIVKIQQDSTYPVRGVVFMGMGEPMLNYHRVMEAAKIMTEPSGLAIDSKAITISTVGIVPGIRRYTKSGRKHRLIVSLTSAIPERRAELLPMTHNYSLEQIFTSLKEYYQCCKRRVPLAWTLISGVNTGLDEVKALAEWVKDLPVLIDMIPVNDDTGQFAPPGKEETDQFISYLKEIVRQPIIMRYSGGQDIAGACGMLAGRSNLKN